MEAGVTVGYWRVAGECGAGGLVGSRERWWCIECWLLLWSKGFGLISWGWGRGLDWFIFATLVVWVVMGEFNIFPFNMGEF